MQQNINLVFLYYLDHVQVRPRNKRANKGNGVTDVCFVRINKERKKKQIIMRIIITMHCLFCTLILSCLLMYMNACASALTQPLFGKISMNRSIAFRSSMCHKW